MTRLGLVSFGTLLFCSALLSAEDRKGIPVDFKIIARFSPGFSDWKGWRSTITNDGKVIKEFPGSKEDKDETISKDDLMALVGKVEEAKFFALKKRYTFNVTDNPTLVLRVTMDGKTHEVNVYAPSHLKDDEEVKRFFKVWSEVLRKVPSPNPGQKPDAY